MDHFDIMAEQQLYFQHDDVLADQQLSSWHDDEHLYNNSFYDDRDDVYDEDEPFFWYDY